MPALTPTASNVKLITGFTAVPGTLGEAVDAGDFLEFSSGSGTWFKSNYLVEDGVQTAIALVSGAVGQTITLSVSEDDEIDFGTVLTVGQVYCASSVDGEIVPHSDLNMATTDELFIIGYAETASVMKLLLRYTGIGAAT